ncbi:cation:proton antiporter [Methanoplanus limicola]|uniref:Potassium/proton antiporter membrane subunit, CPA2 family n=1 Tax=Methanoplanus limicola DSM 2279 TaxID=937775 RepID=H1Z0N7_9EURY|nr:cation:proton antiporter [Methanoplanus limicola]EHQ35294.1 potassium/proton antiporter membrane subunit, CPA2 family [Methanoplanus limicola DSM 2279]
MIEGDIAFALLLCLSFALFSKKFNFPPVPMYMLGGIAIGVSGLNIVHESGVSNFLTHLGLLFLLFMMGLELNPSGFSGKKRNLFFSGLTDLGVNILIGFAASVLLGFPLYEAFVIAAAFYISSSAMAVSSLIENRKLSSPESETILWLMVFEDIMLLFIIVAFSAASANPAKILLSAAFVIAFFFIAVRLLGSKIRVLLERDDDIPLLFTFTAVIAAAGISGILGIPDTLTAIALGSALSSTNPEMLEKHAKPFRDVFLILFFVFFGISVDLTDGFPVIPVVILALLAIASKLLSSMAIGMFVHKNPYSGIEVWSETTARGEFSLAIASMYGTPLITTTVAMIVLITSFTGGFMGRYSYRIKRFFREKRRAKQDILSA